MNKNSMRTSLLRPFRYEFFTIWGNGLTHKDEILDILRNEDSLEIIRIESRTVKKYEEIRL